MNIYFFFRYESYERFYNLVLEAWEENDNSYIDGKKASSFKLLEKLKIHCAKSHSPEDESKRFHCARLDHEFGTDLCTGHNAKSPKEFINTQTNSYQPMTQINHENFQRFKKVALAIYQKYPQINYYERLLQPAPTCRILN